LGKHFRVPGVVTGLVLSFIFLTSAQNRRRTRCLISIVQNNKLRQLPRDVFEIITWTDCKLGSGESQVQYDRNISTSTSCEGEDRRWHRPTFQSPQMHEVAAAIVWKAAYDRLNVCVVGEWTTAGTARSCRETITRIDRLSGPLKKLSMDLWSDDAVHVPCVTPHPCRKCD
jgi:hypothetical protein